MGCATFITPSWCDPEQVGAPAPYLRKEFDVDRQLRRATLHVTARGLIEACVNGTPVGDEVLAPGWTAYDRRLVVSSYQVTALLTAGRKALGAMLGEGWAVGGLAWEPDKRKLWADRPAGFRQLELTYDDRTEVVCSDGSWAKKQRGGSRRSSRARPGSACWRGAGDERGPRWASVP